MGQVSFSVPQTGQWTVTGHLNGETITQTVNVTDKNAVYPIEFLFNSASITVISPVGTSLLLQNGTNQLTKISTGTDIFIVTAMGTWTISGTLEGYTLNSTSVTVQDGEEYQTQLSIQIAALTVNAPSGTIVTVSGNGQQNNQTVTGTSVVFSLTALDTYTVSGTNGSFVTSTETVDVASFQPYSVALTLSIATITVTTVAGTLVQAKKGATTLSGTATDGTITFETQTFGTWNISGTFSGYTFPQQSVNVQAYQDYPVNLQPSVATLTVTAPDGTYITAQSGDTVYYGISSGTSAEILIYVLGEYTVSGENNGLVSDTQTVDVTEFTVYSTTLTIWSATITVTTPTGTTVTAVNGDTELSETSYNGTAVFTVQKTGTWTLSASFDTQTATTTVNVTEQTSYTATLRVPTIVVTTVSGSIVTCTQSTTVLTKTAQGNNVYFYPPTTGEWVLNATLNQQSSNTVIVDVQNNQDYPLMLDYEFATITVTTVSDTEVTAQNGAITIVQTAIGGTAVFEIATMGEWTISATVAGEFLSEIVNVTETTNYDVTLLNISEPTYYATASPLSVARSNLSASSVGDYVLFSGGNNSTELDIVDTYTSSLSKGTASALSIARTNLVANSISDYALFAGGCSQDTMDVYDVVNAYNSMLTTSTPTALSQPRFSLSSANVGDYVLFAAGSSRAVSGGIQSPSSVVDAYNSQLTRTIADSLSQGFYTINASQVGGYAVFGGGVSFGTTNIVNAYSELLIRTIPAKLSVPRDGILTSYVNGYALFAGGASYTNEISTVDAYNSGLTRINPTALSYKRSDGTGVSFGYYALFGGGLNGAEKEDSVEVYDAMLTRTTITSLSEPRSYLASASIQRYALLGGGEGNDYSSTVDVYST